MCFSIGTYQRKRLRLHFPPTWYGGNGLLKMRRELTIKLREGITRIAHMRGAMVKGFVPVDKYSHNDDDPSAEDSNGQEDCTSNNSIYCN